MEVVALSTTEVKCKIINGGTVSNHKGINIPGCSLSMPYISEQDRADIAFAVQEDFDFIAASFARNKDDIMLLRRELALNNCDNIRIISKLKMPKVLKISTRLLEFLMV